MLFCWQVCTLTAGQLYAAATDQLDAWISQQQDLELPSTGLNPMYHEFPVKGHPSTPFVVASTALWSNPAGSSSSGDREAVLLLAAVGDVGLTGTRVPGLVMHWTAVSDDQIAIRARSRDVTLDDVSDLPEGWTTLPDLSWDSGERSWLSSIQIC